MNSQNATKIILCWARPLCLVQSNSMMKYLIYFTCRIQVFWYMTLCHCVNCSWCFEGTWWSYLQGLGVPIDPWSWSRLSFQNVWSHIPADTMPYSHWHSSMCPLTQYHVPTDTVPCTHWHSAMYPLTQFHVPTDTVPCTHWHSAMYPLTQCHVPTDTVPCTRRHESSEIVFWESQILQMWFAEAGTLMACTRVICWSRNAYGLYSARIQFQYRSAYLLFCLRYRVVCSSSLWHRSCTDHLLPLAFQFIIGCHPVIRFSIVWVTGR